MWKRVFWSALLGLVALVLASNSLWAQVEEGNPGQGPARRLAREPGERGPRPAAEGAHLQAEIQDLLARAERLEAEGQFEDAKALRDRAETLRAQLRELVGARRAGAEGQGLPGRPGLQAVARLRSQADKLEAEGNADAATKLREQADQLEKLIQAAQENFQREQALRQQLAQLTAQARDLRAQGKEDDAAEVTKKAQGLEEELRALLKRREEARQQLQGGGLGLRRRAAEGERPAEGLRREGQAAERAPVVRGPEGAPPQGREVQEELRRLRAEVQELRQEVNRLRELLTERREPRGAETR
jgi:DNA repair exonuclease SbcCD ATPase subunit